MFSLMQFHRLYLYFQYCHYKNLTTTCLLLLCLYLPVVSDTRRDYYSIYLVEWNVILSNKCDVNCNSTAFQFGRGSLTSIITFF